MEELTQLKQEHNERMTSFINAVATMTQEQIDACAWVMGEYGNGWTKDTISDDLINDKYDA